MQNKTKARQNTNDKLYSLGEEIFSSITHGIGAALSIVALSVLLVFAVRSHQPIGVVSAAVFGATLIILYLCSTLYHSISIPTVKHVFRVFDHCAIYLLIAGTYTPYTLYGIGGKVGWMLFAGVWFCAILGIVLNAISLKKFKAISMVLYIAMGLCIFLAYKPMVASFSVKSIAFLLGGGAFYLTGLIFYGLKSKRYMHSIWHLFVLAGSVLHFISILFLYL